MESNRPVEQTEQEPRRSFARRVGELALCTTASFLALKVGGEILNTDLPLHIETAIAASAGTYAATMD